MAKATIEKQAKYLAAENRKDDPDISEIYWFPDDEEVRLVEVHATIPKTVEDEFHPFYFRPSPDHELPAASGIALIRAEEVRRLRPPKEWGDWNLAVKIEDAP